MCKGLYRGYPAASGSGSPNTVVRLLCLRYNKTCRKSQIAFEKESGKGILSKIAAASFS